MTVNELLEQLQGVPGDAELFRFIPGGEEYIDHDEDILSVRVSTDFFGFTKVVFH